MCKLLNVMHQKWCQNRVCRTFIFVHSEVIVYEAWLALEFLESLPTESKLGLNSAVVCFTWPP